MSFTTLLVVAIGGAFSVMWLIHYIPLKTKLLGKFCSPRLAVCGLLKPFDAVITMLLVCGAWTGIGTAVLGIGMVTYNVMTGIGLSMGALAIRKFFIPRWEAQYRLLKEE